MRRNLPDMKKEKGNVMKYHDAKFIVELFETVERFAGKDVDQRQLKELIGAEVERLQSSQAAFAEAAGGATCRSWFTITCESSADGGSDGGVDGDVVYMQRKPIDSGPKPRQPIAWGGSSCWTVGKCRICVHYECQRVLAN